MPSTPRAFSAYDKISAICAAVALCAGLSAAHIGEASAADFDSGQVDNLKQTNNAKNSLALAIGGSKAAAGANLACGGVKTKSLTQQNTSRNALSLAILGSKSYSGGNVVGRC